MPPRKGRGHRGAAEPEDRVDRIERILEGLVQVVHDVHNNNNHDEAPQQSAMPMPGARAMPRTTIKQFQQLRPPTFYGTPDPMAAESWLLGIERVFEVLPCTDEQKILESVQRGVFPQDGPRSEDSRVFELKQGNMIVVVYNAKFMELSRYAPHIVSTESRKARRFEVGLRWNIKNKVEILRLPTHQEVLHAALIAEESLNEMSQFRENRKKMIGGNELGHRHQPQYSSPPAERRNNQPRQGRAFALVPGNIPPATTSVCVRVYNSCEIRVNDVPMYGDLIPLEMHGFDVILGMDWLSSYRALIDCELKRVVFHSFAHSGLIFEGVALCLLPTSFSSMKARRLIQKGSQAFLCSIVDTYVSPPTLEDIHVVRIS
ncbi:hypothetical protein Acr_00g0050800 [Actinidia rufa]|uniref:Retrotransposon gag domain-containing protein n=1 Tax=Actinidia rufa TaxID=165716 RepID=A0A7J0DKQ7_9ERIC|nr:hypothetical protein Acr_00g0050800 [Actinidia rufa]